LTWEEAVLWLREQPDQQALVQACFYDDPLLGAAERYRASSEWRAVRQLLPTPGRALDIGAGRGIVAFALARDGWVTAALEPDGSPVVGAAAIRALAVEAGVSIDVHQESGERLPFPDSSFDVVVGRAVMHHARDLSAFCREVHRVLRPRGLFLGLREHVLSRATDLPAFLASHALHRHYGGENAYPLGEYTRILREAGFNLERVINPFASEINLFPQTREEVRGQIAKRLRLPLSLVPMFLLPMVGALINQPGRLYTFVGSKSDG
jgi:SAM-dependent methyltransferase